MKTFKDTVDTFNPVEHGNPETFTFLKLLAFCKGVKVCICAEPGAGKNSNLTLMRQIVGKYSPKIKDVTRAALWRYLYYNNYLNFDEFTTWGTRYVHDVEELISELGDESPDMDKFSLDKNKKMMKIDDLNDKSVTFTFNPPSDDNPNYFNAKFKNYDKIKDRFPILLLEGKVTDTLKRPSSTEAAQTMHTYFKEMCDVTSNVCYWYNNSSKHLNGWSRARIDLDRRHLGNFSRFLDVLDTYCSSQIEYDSWLVWINGRLNAYKALSKGVEMLYTEEEIR